MNFHCPHCQRSLNAKATVAGKMLACPECGKQLTVPSPRPQSTSESPGGVVRNLSKTPLRVKCRICESSYVVPDELRGKRVKCPKCETVYEVPEETSAPTDKSDHQQKFADRASPRSERAIRGSQSHEKKYLRQLENEATTATRQARTPARQYLPFWMWMVAAGSLICSLTVVAVWLLASAATKADTLEVVEWYTTRSVMVRSDMVGRKKVQPKDEGDVILVVTLRLSQTYLGNAHGKDWTTTASLDDFKILTPAGRKYSPTGARLVLIGSMFNPPDGRLDSFEWPEWPGWLEDSIVAPFELQLVVLSDSSLDWDKPIDGEDQDFSVPTTITLMWYLKGESVEQAHACQVRFKDNPALTLTETKQRSKK